MDGSGGLTGADEFQSRLAAKLRRELGSQICGYLTEPDVIEIMLNPDGTLWVDRLGGELVRVGMMSAGQAEALLGTIAAAMKTTITRENPVIECELPIDGSRFEGVIPPIVASPAFTIRRKAVKVFTLQDYVDAGIMSLRQRAAIEQGVADRKNILVVGGTQTGKTTLTNAILQAIAVTAPHHRLVVIEDTNELQCTIENHVGFRTSVHVDQTRLLKITMRMRPDRIVVGEVRDSAALALLKAWNTGHPGGVCTVHANDARAGLIRMEQLIAETTTSPMASLIAEAVDLIVSIAKVGPEVVAARRQVQEVLAITGYSDGQYQFRSAEREAA
ncbi:MAG: P-type conjugative transfer ATPase TrbB [Terracidiphilus sp.]|nr:P-type conjugative transfer ATPase TrbB [Terracidiphilus sp.]